jgi:hypothetical protein
MADNTGSENAESTWNGTTGSKLDQAYEYPLQEGDDNPEIRGTVTSPLNNDELSKVWFGGAGGKSSPSPIPDRSMWPKSSDSGTKESVQGE